MARIEILVVRDPDGATTLTVFVDGVETTDYVEQVVDAGAGHMRSEWDAETKAIRKDKTLTKAFRKAVVAERQDPPGGQYIDQEW